MTTVGPDYASVDGNAPPDFVAAKKAGARFAIPRAVYGRSVTTGSKEPFRDPVWARDKDRIRAAGLKLTGYLFLCFPKPGVFTPEPEVQVDAYADYVILTPNQDLVPMFDVEESSPMTADQMYEWTLRAAKRFRHHYGVWPGMYSGARVWEENLGNHEAGELANCPLWLAKPWPWVINSQVHLDGAPTFSPKLIPEFGNQWFIYQYQGDAIGWPGFNKTVDANRFRVFGPGAKGDHVKWTQHRLGFRGTAVDGDYGPQTTAAVKALQAKYKLAADGFVGLDTFTPLGWQYPAGGAGDPGWV